MALSKSNTTAVIIIITITVKQGLDVGISTTTHAKGSLVIPGLRYSNSK